MPVLLYPPTVKKLHVANSFAANGNNTIVNAPGFGVEIVLAHFLIQNATAVATTAKLLAGSFPFWQRLFQTQGDQFSIVYPMGLEERLGANNALILNLSAANAFNVVVGYWLDAKQ